MSYHDKIPGRIEFKDMDGNTIMNRNCDASWWFGDMLERILASDAKERGVRIVKINEQTHTFVSCTVDYLSRKVK